MLKEYSYWFVCWNGCCAIYYGSYFDGYPHTFWILQLNLSWIYRLITVLINCILSNSPWAKFVLLCYCTTQAQPCRLALTLNWALGCALTCNSSSPLSLCLFKSAIYLESCNTAQFTESDSLCYPTTSVVSSQITIYMVGWSEVTSLHNPSPALLCPCLPILCLYLTISLPIQHGSLWNFKLKGEVHTWDILTSFERYLWVYINMLDKKYY